MAETWPQNAQVLPHRVTSDKPCEPEWFNRKKSTETLHILLLAVTLGRARPHLSQPSCRAALKRQ